jgi:hypothetical protein
LSQVTLCTSGCDYPSITAALAGEPAGEELVVTLEEGVYTEPGTVQVTGRALRLVAGMGASVSVTSAGLGPVFQVESGAALSLTELSAVKVGNRVFDVSAADLSIDGGVFFSLGLVNQGGVLRAVGGRVTVAGARFLSSISTGGGGLVSLDAVEFTATDTTFVDGFALRGGAVSIEGGGLPVTFDGCVFEGNEALDAGGAIATSAEALVVIRDSTFTGNRAARGGAVAALERTNAQRLQVDTSEFQENQATNLGGAVYLERRDAVLTTCRFVENQAGYGGAVSTSGARADLLDGFFCRNEASADGGAIHLNSAVRHEWIHTRFVDNVAERGGAVAVDPGGRLDLSFSSLLGNRATRGAAVFLRGPLADQPFRGYGLLVAWSRGDAGLRFEAAESDIDLDRSLFFDNPLGDFSGPILDLDYVVGDPLLRAYTPGGPCDALDDRYPPESPLRDLGGPAFSDPDGTRADAGMWGGYGEAGVGALPEVWLSGDGDPVPALYDCDDDDLRIYPIMYGAEDPEVWYDGVDQDCDGGSDFDFDRDGFDAEDEGACSDKDADFNPAAVDTLEEDRNCDGIIDADGDGFSPPADCRDDDPAVYPGATEDDDLTVDADCDGFPDPAGTLLPGRCQTAPGPAGWTLVALVWLRRRR